MAGANQEIGGHSLAVACRGVSPRRRSMSYGAHDRIGVGGNSSIGRAAAFQAVGCGFESRFPLQKNNCWRSSVGRAADL